MQAQLRLCANPAVDAPAGMLRLDGRQLELLAIAIDGTPMDSSAYLLDDEGLTLCDVPEQFVLSYNFV